MNQALRARWRTRIRRWASPEPMPITDAELIELQGEFGFAYMAHGNWDVFWFGDPHFAQPMRVKDDDARA